MALFYITYDLRSPGQRYQKLWEHLARTGAQRVMNSLWAAKSPYTAKDIAVELREFIDQNDQLLVINSLDSVWTPNLLANFDKAA